MYLYAAMADLALETDDKSLADACHRLWSNVVQRRMYITGGVGSSAYQEAFTFDYDLPNDTSYTETCAAIGLVFWAQRMLNLELKGEYGDVMERALFNGILSGISQDGKGFFYVNPLEVWPEACNSRRDKRHVKTVRQGWFKCACCPPNVARLLASLGQYIYSQGDHDLNVHLYIGSNATFQLGGEDVHIVQETNYPWEEVVKLSLKLENSSEFSMNLRLPGWCRQPVVKVNGEEVEVQDITHNGYACLKRVWADGDIVELVLPMPIERMQANPSVRMNTGKVALQRGPLVYCLEEIDNGSHITDIALPRHAELVARYEENLLGGVVAISGEAYRTDLPWQNALYKFAQHKYVPMQLRAIPYFAWNNRGQGEMVVWIRES